MLAEGGTERASKAERRHVAAAMNALSHPRRVLIFDRLAEADPVGLTFEGLLRETGLSVSTLSHHLRPMADVGLVERRRKGAFVFHRLAAQPVSAVLGDIADRLAVVAAKRDRVPRRRHEGKSPAARLSTSGGSHA